MKTTVGRLVDLCHQEVTAPDGTVVPAGHLRRLARVKNLPALQKFKIAKILGEASEHTGPFDATKDSLIEKHGEPVKRADGSVIPGAKRVPPGTEAWEKYMEELDPVLDQEVEIHSPKATIPGDLESDEIDGEMLAALDGLVEVK